MLKKVVVLALIVSVVFCGCSVLKENEQGSMENTDTGDVSETRIPVTLEMICYKYSEDSDELWQNIKMGFEEENEDITLNIMVLPWAEANIERETRILNEESLDIVVTDDISDLSNRDLLVSTEDYIGNGLKDRVLYNIDSSYGIPVAGDEFRLFINQGSADVAGINENTISSVGWKAIMHGMEHMGELGITKNFFIEVNDNAYDLSRACLLKSTNETEGNEEITDSLLNMVSGDKDIRKKTAYDGVLSVALGEIGMAVAPGSLKTMLPKDVDISSLRDYPLPGEPYVLYDSFGVLKGANEDDSTRLDAIERFLDYFYGETYENFLSVEGFTNTLKNN